jgi:hypothetical protein
VTLSLTGSSNLRSAREWEWVDPLGEVEGEDEWVVLIPASSHNSRIAEFLAARASVTSPLPIQQYEYVARSMWMMKIALAVTYSGA